jgi:phosphate-selective porin OprO and OprP
MRRSLLPTVLASLLMPVTAFAEGWSVAPAGYYQHDIARYEFNGASDDSDAPRRSRLGLKADHASGVKLRLEWDFINGTITDAYVDWASAGGSKWRFGQYKQPFMLEELISSRELALPERSQAHDAFVIGRRAGLMWTTPLHGQQLQLSAFGGNSEQPSDATGLAARMFGAPSGRKDLHLGASVAYEERSDDRLRLRARPELRLLPSTPMNTGRQLQDGGFWRSGLEAVLLRGSLSLQSELNGLRGSGLNRVSGTGGYVQASWLAGGAQRGLQDGVVKLPKLASGQTLFEYSARVSHVDLERAGAAFGDQSQLSLAATAYIGKHVQLALEQSWFDGERRVSSGALGHDGDFNLLRVQLSF